VNSPVNDRRQWLAVIWLLCCLWAAPLFAQTIKLNLKEMSSNALCCAAAAPGGETPRANSSTITMPGKIID
jgi:hypothetical protein